ncbi:ribonuclease activity regulator RraA [Brevibacterium oceani]|uniref:ribonuclease activity regulator RraA n=1 Tax=Brevibacterium oceani TaxID=358099 RepID=UPI0015E7257E|nr:ribonuclease activity regulator RraA [Brevibacterium oceani]
MTTVNRAEAHDPTAQGEHGKCPLSAEVKAKLKSVSTATLTTQMFKRGYRNVYLDGVSEYVSSGERMVGTAFTMRCIPSREDLDDLSVYDDYDHPQRRGVESVDAGEVLIIDARGRTEAAALGHILATRLKVRGAEGIVTDGAIRDSGDFRELDLPIFVAGKSPVTNLLIHHVLETQTPIGCGEVPVYPGDVLVGDTDGVVCLPRHLAAEVAADAFDQEKLEQFILSKVEQGSPLRDTYPAGPQLREEYERLGNREEQH